MDICLFFLFGHFEGVYKYSLNSIAKFLFAEPDRHSKDKIPFQVGRQRNEGGEEDSHTHNGIT